MNDLPLSAFLVLALLLFGIGLFGALTKRSPIMVLISIELMLNAVNINLIAFAHGGINPGMKGQAFAIAVVVVAVAEAIVGLAILYSLYRKGVTDSSTPWFQLGNWQTYGTCLLLGLSMILFLIAITGDYFG